MGDFTHQEEMKPTKIYELCREKLLYRELFGIKMFSHCFDKGNRPSCESALLYLYITLLRANDYHHIAGHHSLVISHRFTNIFVIDLSSYLTISSKIFLKLTNISLSKSNAPYRAASPILLPINGSFAEKYVCNLAL